LMSILQELIRKLS